MNLKEGKEGDIKGFRRWKVKEQQYDYVITKKLKEVIKT